MQGGTAPARRFHQKMYFLDRARRVVAPYRRSDTMYIDQTRYTTRPTDGRIPQELAIYDRLEELSIPDRKSVV